MVSHLIKCHFYGVSLMCRGVEVCDWLIDSAGPLFCIYVASLYMTIIVWLYILDFICCDVFDSDKVAHISK